MSHYKTLGVSDESSQEHIKSSFRRLARENHPDRYPGDRAREARFKQIAAAYEVVGDPTRRAAYDAARRARIIPTQHPRSATPWKPAPNVSPWAQLLVKLAELAVLSMVADVQPDGRSSTHRGYHAYRRRK